MIPALLALSAALAAPVTGQVDLQCHLAMHLALPAYGRGPDQPLPRRPMDHRHLTQQQMVTPYLAASGARIISTAAFADEATARPATARRKILAQLRYVEDWVGRHADTFALARTPAEARAALADGRIAVVQAIEGAAGLLSNPEDATFWAAQGVVLVTPIHLVDDVYGGAMIAPEGFPSLFNRGALRRQRRDPALRRGLTDAGRRAVAALATAGILVDLSHMAPPARQDASDLLAGLGAPPIYTHTVLGAFRQEERGLSDAEVVALYRAGGLLGLPLNGAAMDPLPATPLDGYCAGTTDAFRLHHDHLARLLDATFGPLGEDESGPLAIGWASDFNGMVNHFAPKYGRQGCVPTPPADALPFDTLGLGHAGMLPQVWTRLASEGMDLAYLDRSAERFLRIWERAQAR